MATYKFPDEAARAKHHDFISRGQALSKQLASAKPEKKAGIQRDLDVHMGRHQRYLAQYEVKPGAAAPQANGGQAQRVAPRPVKLDTARQDADEAERVRNSGSRGGVKRLDPAAIAAADQELEERSRTAAGARDIAAEREGMAIQTGRNRFDVDAQPTATAAPAATPKPARKAPARSAAPVTTTRKASPSAPPAAAPQSAPAPVQSAPAERPTGAVNRTPMAPTAQTAPAEPSPQPAKAGPQRYGRPEASGQGTLFGVTGFKGKKADRDQAGRGLAFGEGAASHTEGPSGPIRGDQPMFTEKGNPTRVTGATAPKATQARPARAPASKPAVAQAEEPVLSRPKSSPVNPGKEGPGTQSRHVEAPSMGETGSAPVTSAPAIPEHPPTGSKITRREGPRTEGRTGAGGRGVWGMPGVEAPQRTGLNGPQAAQAEPAPVHEGHEPAPVTGPAETGEASVSAPKPTGRGRTNVSTPRDTSPRGVHVEGNQNIIGNNSGNTTTNTYNYHIGGDVHGGIGGPSGGGGGGRVPRVGGGAAGPRGRAAGGGQREAGHRPDKPDIWVNDVNGHHSLREGYEHITGQADSAGRPTRRAREHEHAQRTGRIPTSAGASQRPIGGGPRAQGGASGTGTNFNWSGPVHPMGPTSTGGSSSGPSFASGNGGYGSPGTPVTPGKPGTLNWDED